MMHKAKRLHRNVILVIALLCCCPGAWAQLVSPKLLVCDGEDVTYTFYSGFNCTITWTIISGTINGSHNATTYTNGTTNSSTVTVHWINSGSTPNIHVSAACGAGDVVDDRDVEIDYFSLSVSSSASTVTPGTVITLTANSSLTNTYTWSATAGGNLNTTTGNPVTATPNYTSVTYYATGTHQWVRGNSPNQTTHTCTKNAFIIITMPIQPITGNVICCDVCKLVDSYQFVNPFQQAAGVTLAGGGTPRLFKWEKKVEGGNWQEVEGATQATYGAPRLLEKTWYRRIVYGSGVAPSTSNVVLADVYDAPNNPTYLAGTYSVNTVKKGIGTLTVSGVQNPVGSAQLVLLASNKVVVQAEAVLKTGVWLRSGMLCEEPFGPPEARIASEPREVSVEVIFDEEPSQFDGPFNIYPNPSDDHAVVAYSSTTAVTVTLVDVLGNEVRHVEGRRTSGSSASLTLEITGLPAGIYFCKFSSSGRTLVKRLVVKH